MKLTGSPIEWRSVSGAGIAVHGMVDIPGLLAACRAERDRGGRLVALWGSDERDRAGGFRLHVALGSREGLRWLAADLPADNPAHPDLAGVFPCAARMQRANFDLLGIRAEGGDTRPWLRHAAWPADFFALRGDADPGRRFPATAEDYAFVRVEGDGVHEIPVGPIHAGIIEPGHFRFSVVGEKVLRLEQRLGYKHKGIERRFAGLPLAEGHRLAGRVSGDSTVAYAWAYCQALESAAQILPPPRASWLRGLMLERERVANHLGDLGALGNDAAFSFGFSQFMRLKEDWLRLNQRLWGHRLLMDRIVPGGVCSDLDIEGRELLLAQCDAIEAEVRVLKDIYDEHAGVQDRFLTTGRLDPQLAAQLGVVGPAGRASGQGRDLRVDFPGAPYDRLGVKPVGHRNGDVAARVIVRFEETFESLRLIREMAGGLPEGEIQAAVPPAATGALGVGWIEGWRGEILVALETGARDTLRRCHCHDPSWQNWPALEHAVMGNIVPDFPLINKSFNLSYSGQDL